MPGWSWRRDGAAALGLALLVAATRWPLRAHWLSTTDSVLFALASERYDVFALRPHAPGYPVYVGLVRLFRLAWDDPNVAMVALAIALSAGAVVALHALLRQWLDPLPAAAAAALFALSPALMANGIIATSYAGEALAASATALLAWRCRLRPGPRSALALGALFGLALGLRQSVLFFLLPMAAWGLLQGPRGLRPLAARAGAFAAASGAVALAWLLPAMAASGGPARFLAATRLQSEVVVFGNTVFTGGWAAFADHRDRLLHFLSFDAALGIAALAFLGLALLRGRGRILGSWGPEAGLLAAWILPSLAFYLLVFDGWGKGPLGYVLVLLPALYAAAALLAWHALAPAAPEEAGDGAAGGAQRRRALLAAALLLAPAPALLAQWAPLAEEVAEHDAWAADWQRIEEAFPPETTALLATYSWAHAKWHFPEHVLWSPLTIDPGREGTRILETRHREDEVPYYAAYLGQPPAAEHPVPPGIRHVVLMDFQVAGENGGTRMLRPEVVVHEARVGDGWRILYFDTDAAHPTIESYLAP